MKTRLPRVAANQGEDCLEAFNKRLRASSAAVGGRQRLGALLLAVTLVGSAFPAARRWLN